MEQLKEILDREYTTTCRERNISLAEMAVEDFNQERGDLTGYDCPLCFNKGVVAILQDGEDRYKTCTCMEVRRMAKMQKSSGLEMLLDAYTFDRYEADEKWQRAVLDTAQQYARDKRGWFYIGGRPGTGKTHICTAIVKELMRSGIACRYMMWRDEAPRIKAAVNDERYERMTAPLKETACLYIDDFLKGGVTQGDINLAYEIINYRYNAQSMTIISSEKTIREILEIDEALGSRIYERTGKGENMIDLKNVSNYRLRG